MSETANQPKKRGRRGFLSVRIDPLLLEGGRTITEVAEAVHSNLVDGDAARYTKAIIVNNVRSRMNILGKKGYSVEADANRKVKLVAPVPTEA